MKNKKKVTLEIHKSIDISLVDYGKFHNFVKEYRYFCYYSGTLLFSKVPDVVYTKAFAIPLYYVISNLTMSYRRIHITTIKSIFPFLIYKKKETDWLSEWHESEILTTIFKSRESIIDEILEWL